MRRQASSGKATRDRKKKPLWELEILGINSHAPPATPPSSCTKSPFLSISTRITPRTTGGRPQTAPAKRPIRAAPASAPPRRALSSPPSPVLSPTRTRRVRPDSAPPPGWMLAARKRDDASPRRATPFHSNFCVDEARSPSYFIDRSFKVRPYMGGTSNRRSPYCSDEPDKEMAKAQREFYDKQRKRDQEADRNHAAAAEIFADLMEEVRTNALKAANAGGKMDLQKIFRRIDVDGSGTIDLNEFGRALMQMGVDLPGEELALVFQFLDRDGAGVDYGEFQLAFFNRASLAKQPRPKIQERSAAHHWMLKMESLVKDSAIVEDTLRLLDSSSNSNPEKWHVRQTSGLQNLKDGRFEQSVRDFTYAILDLMSRLDECPTHLGLSMLYAHRSRAFDGLADYLSAFDDASQSVEWAPGSYKSHLALGDACFRLRRYLDAAGHYKRGLRVKPKHPVLVAKLDKAQYHGKAVQYGIHEAPGL